MILPIPDSTPCARLVRHLDVSAFGSELMTIGDIDNDGRAEFVFTQSAGMLGADQFKPGAGGRRGLLYTTPQDQALDCLTAVDPDGHIRWQHGTPWAEPIPFRQHGGHWMLRVEDIDGDGRNEVVRLRGDTLALLDGADGTPRASVRLDNDGYSALHTARFSRDGSRTIIVKPCSSGVDGHPYGNPVVAYDCQLRQVWARRDFLHTGHTAVAWDVDGDGLDELLIGFQCAGADGAVRWTLPLAGEGGHPDRCTVADIDGDGAPEVVMACEGFGVVVATLDGQVRWRHPATHCGEACVGKFYGDLPGLQVMGNDETWRQEIDGNPAASYLLDGAGRLCWQSPYDRYARAIDWPTALGPQAMLARPHVADPADARPFVMDGAGTPLAQFDIPRRLPRFRDYPLPHTVAKWGDWGDSYGFTTAQLDGAPRIVIWSRSDLWIFAMETG